MRNPTLPGWQSWDAFVPKVFEGRRHWNADGPVEVPLYTRNAMVGRVYAWRGPHLVCVNCPDAKR